MVLDQAPEAGIVLQLGEGALVTQHEINHGVVEAGRVVLFIVGARLLGQSFVGGQVLLGLVRVSPSFSVRSAP